MEGTSAHRKIELQAPEDLTYLIANVRRAAQERLDEAFPPVAGTDAGEDELRTQIEALVHEYITRTFTLAAPNLSINGLDIDPSSPLVSQSAAAAAQPTQPEEVYEPFDARKRQRVEDLTREEEDLLREIAALKRQVPAAAAQKLAEQMRAGVAADEEALAARRAHRSAAAEREGQDVGVELLSEERQRGMEGAFADAVAGLGRLKKEMPATVAKMERARVAGEYVVAGR